MANWFDTVTKTLADSKLGRRQALKTIAGTVAGAAVAAYIPGSAFAKKHHGVACKNIGSCTTGFSNCMNNVNCFCFQNQGRKGGSCGCNSYCASIPPCSSQSQCSKGHSCITNTGCGCTSGFCIPNCSKTCHFPDSRVGRTAA